MQIIYRLATADDSESLAVLRWEMEAETHDSVMARSEYIAAYLATASAELQNGRHRAWLAESEGAIVGCALLVSFVMPPDYRERVRLRGLVTSVYVRPAYRRQGIATELMRALIGYARDGGIRLLFLWPTTSARALYESMDFQAADVLELEL